MVKNFLDSKDIILIDYLEKREKIPDDVIPIYYTVNAKLKEKLPHLYKEKYLFNSYSSPICNRSCQIGWIVMKNTSLTTLLT